MVVGLINPYLAPVVWLIVSLTTPIAGLFARNRVLRKRALLV